MEFKYVFKNGQSIQANENNTILYIVQRDVITNDPNELVTVKVMTEMGNPYFKEVKTEELANLCDCFDSWMSR